ncbi:MAG TPA: protein kinase [Bryobacteraceae bacterium]|nr:protein kinase [Bryobacteraceae bacterium]
MTPELWASVKALYLEASDTPGGLRSVLEASNRFNEEAIEMVRELLASDPDGCPRIDRACWLPAAEDAAQHALDLGQVLLSRFEVVGFLGSGGVGEVYRVFDREQDVFVALKTLRPLFAGSPGARDTLRRELNTARLVTSPFVCRLYESYWPSDAVTPPFFTMELLEGETLSHYLRRETLTPATAMRIADQIISALDAAHSKGVAHRDFKSGNVMLLPGASKAVVMDFGCAREVVPAASIETTIASETFAGTPAYMAPEQLKGHRATFASDIHALGVVMFELVTGRLPFEAESPIEVALRRLNEEAPSPCRFVRGLDRRWEYAILRCLEVDPERRPASALAVRELLQKGPPWIWHRRRILVTAACAVPIFAAGGGWWAAAERRRVVTVDVFDIENRSGDRALDFLCRGTTSELIRRYALSTKISPIAMRATLAASASGGGSALAIGGMLSAADKTLKLTMQIVDPQKSVVWEKTYPRERFQDLLQLQGEMANEIAGQLIRRSALTGRDLLAEWLPVPGFAATGAPTANAAAFDYYMKGSSLQQEYTETALRAAVGFFERAVAEDPHFSLAFASLADCNLSLLNFGFDFDSATAEKARDCARRSLLEDPQLPEAHAVMGAVDQVDWDWLAAEAEFSRALQLRPGYSKAIRWRAGLVAQFARFDEAISEMKRALRIDPYDRGAAASFAAVLFFAGRYREAADFLPREIGDRDMVSARYNLALANLMLAKSASVGAAAGLYSAALDQARFIAAAEVRSGGSNSEVSDRLFALAHSMMRHNELAAPYLDRLERNVEQRRTSPGANATIYVAQNRLEEAQIALEQALILHDRFLLYLRVNPLLAPLRGHPRFEALLATMHLN